MNAYDTLHSLHESILGGVIFQFARIALKEVVTVGDDVVGPKFQLTAIPQFGDNAPFLYYRSLEPRVFSPTRRDFSLQNLSKRSTPSSGEMPKTLENMLHDHQLVKWSMFSVYFDMYCMYCVLYCSSLPPPR